jgi:hypothetical protein
MMARLTFSRFSRRICRDCRHRVDLAVAPSEHWRQRCFVTNSLGQQRADLEGKTAQHTHHDLARRHGHGEGTWPTILGPLHELVDGLPDATIRSLLSDTFLRAYAADRRALTGVTESSGPRVADFGPRS